MRKGAKIRKMIEFEMMNCKKNISFYKDQMRKNRKNRAFYAEQVTYMERKLEELRNKQGFNLSILEKLQGIL